MATKTILEAPKLSNKKAVNNLANLLTRKQSKKHIKGAKTIKKNSEAKANLQVD